MSPIPQGLWVQWSQKRESLYMPTFTPDAFIEALSRPPGPGPHAKRAIKHLHRMKEAGTRSMSVGTWAPQAEPVESPLEFWAEHWSNVMDALADGGSYACLPGHLDNRFIHWVDRYVYGPLMLTPYRFRRAWRGLVNWTPAHPQQVRPPLSVRLRDFVRALAP